MLFWYVYFLIKYFIWADTCIKMLWKGNNSLFFFFLEKIWPNAERKNGTWHSRSKYQSEKKTFIGGEKITVNKVHVLTYRNRKAANPTSVYLHFTAFLMAEFENQSRMYDLNYIVWWPVHQNMSSGLPLEYFYYLRNMQAF